MQHPSVATSTVGFVHVEPSASNSLIARRFMPLRLSLCCSVIILGEKQLCSIGLSKRTTAPRPVPANPPLSPPPLPPSPLPLTCRRCSRVVHVEPSTSNSLIARRFMPLRLCFRQPIPPLLPLHSPNLPPFFSPARSPFRPHLSPHPLC
ncbi:unnamed protein product [Closterium sp. NIES-53]